MTILAVSTNFSLLERLCNGLSSILPDADIIRETDSLMAGKYLLRNTNYSILEIANNIGFSSVGYYNRLFKKYYHTTPSFYRKNLNLNA